MNLAILVAVAQEAGGPTGDDGGVATLVAGVLLLIIVVAGVVGFVRNVRQSRRRR